MKKFYKLESRHAFSDARDIEANMKDIKAAFQNPNILDSEDVNNLFSIIRLTLDKLEAFNTNLATYLKANVITEEDAEILKEQWYKQYNCKAESQEPIDDEDDLPF